MAFGAASFEPLFKNMLKGTLLHFVVLCRRKLQKCFVRKRENRVKEKGRKGREKGEKEERDRRE